MFVLFVNFDCRTTARGLDRVARPVLVALEALVVLLPALVLSLELLLPVWRFDLVLA